MSTMGSAMDRASRASLPPLVACPFQDSKPGTRNPKPGICNPYPDSETRNPEPGAHNPAPEARDPKSRNPETRNIELRTRNPEPETRNPDPEPRNRQKSKSASLGVGGFVGEGGARERERARERGIHAQSGCGRGVQSARRARPEMMFSTPGTQKTES